MNQSFAEQLELCFRELPIAPPGVSSTDPATRPAFVLQLAPQSVVGDSAVTYLPATGRMLEAVTGIRIEVRAVVVKGDFEASVFNVRQRVKKAHMPSLRIG